MFEYHKYCKWAKKKYKEMAKSKLNKIQNENTKQVIDLVQKDIDIARANYEKTLAQTEETLVTALGNLQKEKVTRWIEGNELIEQSVYNGVEGTGIATIKIPIDKDGKRKW
jgi:hypothetical protein